MSLVLILTFILYADVNTQGELHKETDNSVTTQRAKETVLNSSVGALIGFGTTLVGETVAFYTALFLCNSVGLVLLPFMALEVVFAAVAGSVLTSLLLKDESNIIRNAFFTGGVVALGILVGSLLGATVIGPRDSFSLWGATDGIWFVIVPGAMLGSLLGGTASSTLIGFIYAQEEYSGN